MEYYRAQQKCKMTMPPERVDVERKKRSRWRLIVTICSLFVLSAGMSSAALAQTQSAASDSASVNINTWDLGQGFSEYFHISQTRAFGDYSINEALTRVPGVQVSRDREINLRGVGYQAYAVQYNGQRLANTGLGSRNIDLGSFSTDAFSSIEIIKVLDPSMDADALAGVVNLKSRRPVAEGRKVSAIAGGGANPTYISRTGPSTRGWLNYSERYTDAFAVNVDLSYQQEQKGIEELGINYGTEDFGSGPVDVFNRVSPSLHINQRDRFATSVEASFDPTETDTYTFRGLFNSEDQSRVSHQDTWAPNGGWSSPDSATAEEGAFWHRAGTQDITTTQFALHARGENQLESLNLSYQAGWSQGRTESRDYLFPFMLEGLNYAVDRSDREHPQLSITNRETQVLDDGTVDRQFMIGQDFERVMEEHVNNEFSARVDVELPIPAGAIKAGGSARLTTKEGEYDENSFEYNRTLRMISFNMLREPNRNIDVINGHYQLPWFVNTDNARAFLEDQRPLFTADDNLNAYQSEIRNYEANEQIYAAYGMTELNFGKLGLTGGVRVEYTSSEYTGNDVLFNEDGDFEGSQNEVVSENDFQLFPNAQLHFDVTDESRLRAAYSRSLDRPGYYQLTPFERTSHLDSTIFRGNPALDPVTADNLDLVVEQQISATGKVSVGGFYKELSDFTVLREGTQSDGYRTMEYANSSNTATIYGVELELAQALNFLPGIFSHFGVYGNYTWSQSDYETDRGELAFPGQSPNVVNAALSYSLPRFSARVAYHWSDEILTDIREEREMAPSISSSPVYMDRYEEGYQDLSATAEYQLSERFRAWANVQNILGFDQTAYENSSEYYPTSTYVRGGLDIRIGVRFDL